VVVPLSRGSAAVPAIDSEFAKSLK
jgi:hypothetical protein